MDTNKMLSEILGYYKQRVDRNLCTMAEMNDALKALESNMEIHGTIQDFADYYGKSKDAVNSVIKRNLIAKPKKNITLYPFHAFRKVVPTSWRKK